MSDSTHGQIPGAVLTLLLVGLLAGCALLPSSERDDAVADAVERALYDQLDTNLLHVDVTVEEGVAYLDGEVEEVGHRMEAERVAARIAGVRRVVNKLRVFP